MYQDLSAQDYFNKDSCSALVIINHPLLTDRFAVMKTAELDHLKVALAAHGRLIREWNVRIQRLLDQVACLSTADPQTNEQSGPSRAITLSRVSIAVSAILCFIGRAV